MKGEEGESVWEWEGSSVLWPTPLIARSLEVAAASKEGAKAHHENREDDRR